MTAYRVVWMVLCAVLAVIGTIEVFVLSPATLLILFLVFAFAGPILTPVVVGEFWDRSARERRGLLVTGAMVSGTAAGAVAGLGVILGPAVVPLVFVGMASSPYAVNVYRRWVVPAPPSLPVRPDTPGPASSPTSEPGPAGPLSELDRLTDEELCRRWRASYLTLRLPPSDAAILQTVEQRQRYLDEFERRNAGGLTEWLASGARAAGNPLPYLRVRRRDRHAINWDELTRGQDR